MNAELQNLVNGVAHRMSRMRAAAVFHLMERLDEVASAGGLEALIVAFEDIPCAEREPHEQEAAMRLVRELRRYVMGKPELVERHRCLVDAWMEHCILANYCADSTQQSQGTTEDALDVILTSIESRPWSKRGKAELHNLAQLLCDISGLTARQGDLAQRHKRLVESLIEHLIYGIYPPEDEEGGVSTSLFLLTRGYFTGLPLGRILREVERLLPCASAETFAEATIDFIASLVENAEEALREQGRELADRFVAAVKNGGAGARAAREEMNERCV